MNTRFARHSHDKVAGPSEVTILVASQLAVYQTRVIGNAAAGAFTLTLPSVAAAEGMTYSIRSTHANDVTVVSDGDSPTAISQVLADANDAVLLYSDGQNWWILSTLGI